MLLMSQVFKSYIYKHNNMNQTYKQTNIIKMQSKNRRFEYVYNEYTLCSSYMEKIGY